eukprot:TRINITY_DN2550_c0_g1_i2.p1 TRINITY_DN2550_c0_g1~~TRINITY_DN2550_c0_g1_i2.p1  ORF type:complete len:326 (+),score=74.31 TRINITY_DN2550_c0_g1_i2:50-1027(+)
MLFGVFLLIFQHLLFIQGEKCFNYEIENKFLSEGLEREASESYGMRMKFHTELLEVEGAKERWSVQIDEKENLVSKKGSQGPYVTLERQFDEYLMIPALYSKENGLYTALFHPTPHSPERRDLFRGVLSAMSVSLPDGFPNHTTDTYNSIERDGSGEFNAHYSIGDIDENGIYTVSRSITEKDFIEFNDPAMAKKAMGKSSVDHKAVFKVNTDRIIISAEFNIWYGQKGDDPEHTYNRSFISLASLHYKGECNENQLFAAQGWKHENEEQSETGNRRLLTEEDEHELEEFDIILYTGVGEERDETEEEAEQRRLVFCCFINLQHI